MKESREHILKVALVLFLQKSFKAVTMKEIVEKTGLSKGAFYHYFSSKEELFNEVIRTFYLKMMAIEFEKFDQKSFYGFYHNYVDYVMREFMGLKNLLNDTNDEDDINYLLLAFDAINIFPDYNQLVTEHHARELTAWAEAVARGKASGELHSVMTDEQIARMFVYSSDGIGLHLIQEGRIRQLGTEMLALWDGFYKQIKA
jgi:AcrR family transcriptional regulator